MIDPRLAGFARQIETAIAEMISFRRSLTRSVTLTRSGVDLKKRHRLRLSTKIRELRGVLTTLHVKPIAQTAP